MESSIKSGIYVYAFSFKEDEIKEIKVGMSKDIKRRIFEH